MKKVALIIIAVLMSIGIYADDASVNRDTTTYNPVYYSFTDKVVSTADVNWKDSLSVTAFLKANVPGIPDGYTFTNYRTNQDKEKFWHYDCRQVNQAAGLTIDYHELIVHTTESGQLVYITGDLWTEAPGSAVTTKAKAMRKAKSNKQQNLSILIINGKERLCNKQIENFELTYTDVETGEVVQRQSLISNAVEATQKAKLTGNAYYQDNKYMINPVMSGAIQDGKYVLQDLDRKIFTLNYTDNILNRHTKELYGESRMPFVNFAMTMLFAQTDEMMKLGDNFTSSTGEYGAEHDALTSRLESITLCPTSELTSADGFKFEIRKCKYSKDETADEEWLKGSTLATSDGALSDGNLVFNFENFDVTTPNQENDPDFADKFNDVYIGQMTFNDAAVFTTPISQRCQDDIDTVSVDTGDGNTISFPIYIQRSFVKAQPTIDIHWGLERTYDVYQQQFGINSYDNNYAPLIAIVNYSAYDNQKAGLPNNSCALSVPGIKTNFGTMIFGMGGRGPEDKLGRYYPLVNLSAIGHEFTHLVASKLAAKESKALNESYADIMGKMVERYSLLPHYYMSGDTEISTVSWENAPQLSYTIPQKGLRCFDDPSRYGDPKYYKGTNWDSVKQEEHTNAGVQNYWFYLLCEGGDITPEKGEPVSITPIPRDSAEFIAFSSLMYFATSLLDYSSARKNSVHAAEMYFGKNSQEMETVLKAWYAVGVGTDEWKPGYPTAIDAISSNTTAICSTRKMATNGSIIIQKNGRKYNTAGQRLE